MPTQSRLVLPPRNLANCIAACIVRDTRGTTLSDPDRLNYFPASPLFSVTLTAHGQIHVADQIADVQTLRRRPPAGKLMFEPPKPQPFASWSPGPVSALTIGFFPEAWQRLGGTLKGAPPSGLLPALRHLEREMPAPDWPLFWEEMEQIWRAVGRTDWAGSHLLQDWARHLMLRIAQSSSGHSLRTAQRRLQRWTGQTRSTLDMFAKVEELHRRRLADPGATAAEIAADAGFADQSHMGRTLKRITGFSPVHLNRCIASDEAFWCYRLLGERF